MSTSNDLINAAYPTGTMFPMPWWGGFVTSSPVIPELYWNVYSAEQRWKMIACDIKKMVEYINQQTANINDLDARQIENDQTIASLNTQIQALKTEMSEFEAYINDLIKDITAGAEQWNIADGTYKPTKVAQRNMYNLVTPHAYSCGEIAVLPWTCAQVRDSGLNCRGWAVENTKISDNHSVTDYYLYNGHNDTV